MMQRQLRPRTRLGETMNHCGGQSKHGPLSHVLQHTDNRTSEKHRSRARR
jgi:hypothetical protein